ncbi:MULTISPECIES: hypothetical protein [unclassified Paenibacillus]|uniref:hypothetical protein n=1 Tax=unclassified Paenibacillus TaxID=185978 RepID=UPI001AE30122|nr:MULTISPECIES: hypothetical protein [unclassified Paenibacillus]MBP1153679.1 hypothetical protein [Paenibacillus sp. PvP091]MBP1170936.1 hypothetical protein [Paenibacillus sp. PvR098]MBP2441964.1 hypothetical protein [Paenibacillus sp. PvP052]
MEHNPEESLDWLHAQSQEDQSVTNTVQANKAMDDAFYGNGRTSAISRMYLRSTAINRNHSVGKRLDWLPVQSGKEANHSSLVQCAAA